MLTNIKLFLTLWLCFVLFITYLIFNTNYGSEILYINQNQNSFLVFFFKIFSFLGEWIFIVLLGLFIYLKFKTLLKQFLFAFIIQFSITHSLKNIFNLSRPQQYFNKLLILNGREELFNNSFPSGHTSSSFFVAFFCIAFIISDKRYFITIIAFLYSLLVGLSRIYLFAHFKEDVLVGSAIGIFSVLISYNLNSKSFFSNTK